MATATKGMRGLSKSELVDKLAIRCALSKKQASEVLHTLLDIAQGQIGKRGPGVFVVPGICKILRVHKPAVKSRKGINPFTKQETMFAARPARNVVKVRALKALKDAV